LTLLEQGNYGAGLLWLARGLKIAPADAHDLRYDFRANLATWGRGLRTLGFQGEDSAAALANDEKTLLTAGADGTVRLWDLATDRELARFTVPHGPIRALALGPDGKTALTGGNGGARLWDLAMGKELRPFYPHQGVVHAAAFSPDGKAVLTGGDGGARLHDRATGNELRQLSRGQDVVYTVAFSPDGKAVLTGGVDRKVLLWSVAGDGPPRELPHLARALPPATGPHQSTGLRPTRQHHSHGRRRQGRPTVGRPHPPPRTLPRAERGQGPGCGLQP
jgi:WD40 repeat protein